MKPIHSTLMEHGFKYDSMQPPVRNADTGELVEKHRWCAEVVRKGSLNRVYVVVDTWGGRCEVFVSVSDVRTRALPTHIVGDSAALARAIKCCETACLRLPYLFISDMKTQKQRF